MVYGRLSPAVDAFEVEVNRFRLEGGRGLNVTLPFKERAFRMADRVSDRARVAGAANTLLFDGTGIYADNTDGIGLVRDLTQNLGLSLEGSRILLIGAGGAARGVLMPLLEQKPQRVLVVNRTRSRAQTLCHEVLMRMKEVTGKTMQCEAGGLEGAGLEPFDLVINATSSSLGNAPPDVSPGAFGTALLAYDMMYGKDATPFLAMAKAHGALRCADGLGMLVEQAAESFYLWRGVFPPTAFVLQRLRLDMK